MYDTHEPGISDIFSPLNNNDNNNSGHHDPDLVIKGQLHIVTDIKGQLPIVTNINEQLQIVADIKGRTEVETKCRQDTLQFSTSVELYTQNLVG